MVGETVRDQQPTLLLVSLSREVEGISVLENGTRISLSVALITILLGDAVRDTLDPRDMTKVGAPLQQDNS